MRTYLITFYTNKASNGYAIINANTSKQAAEILKSQGRFVDLGYNIAKIEYLDHFVHGLSIINEGVVTQGKSAYDLAVEYGYTDTEEKWISNLIKAANVGEGIVDENALHKGDNISLLVNDANYTVNYGATTIPVNITNNDSVIYLYIQGKKYMLQAVDLDKPVPIPTINNIVYDYDNNGGGTATIIFNTDVYATSNSTTPTSELPFVNYIIIPLIQGENSTVTIKAFTTVNNINSEMLEQEVTLVNKVATPTATLIGNIQSEEIYISIEGPGNYLVNGIESTEKYVVTANGTYTIKSTIEGQIDSQEISVVVNLQCPLCTKELLGRTSSTAQFTSTIHNFDEARKIIVHFEELHNVKAEISTNAGQTWTEVPLQEYSNIYTADGILQWRITRDSFTENIDSISWTVRHLVAPYILIQANDTSGTFTINNNEDNPSNVTFKYLLNTTDSAIGKTYQIYSDQVSFDASSVGKIGYTYVYILAIATKEGWVDSPKDSGHVLLNNSGNFFWGVVDKGTSITADYIKNNLTAKHITSYTNVEQNFGAFEEKLPIIAIASPFMGNTYTFTLDKVIDPSTNAPYTKDVDFTLTYLTIYGNSYQVILWKEENSTAGLDMKITYKFK